MDLSPQNHLQPKKDKKAKNNTKVLTTSKPRKLSSLILWPVDKVSFDHMSRLKTFINLSRKSTSI